MQEQVWSVSEFVTVLNQTLEFAYPNVIVQGELANFRVSKNRWVYFDLKDENSSVKFFGTVYNLPGPLEDGMLLQVRGAPRLHPLYGFSVNVQTIQPVGEGSIKKAAALLEAKLTAEGLFDPARKRLLPYPPERIGLITSSESAGYKDFIKILNERWSGLKIELMDVQVQGDLAPAQIIEALDHFNAHELSVETIVIIRGGGSADDLAAFSTEQVVRAVAASRIPTMVAIGHEIDVSLAELAADQRASTPSNAAELLVPDKKHLALTIKEQHKNLREILNSHLHSATSDIKSIKDSMSHMINQAYMVASQTLERQVDLLEALNPEAALKRGYAVIRSGKTYVKSVKSLKIDQSIDIKMQDGEASATVNKVQLEHGS